MEYFSKRQESRQKSNPSYQRRPYTCLNCGTALAENLPGPDGRRFCSYNCKEQYLGKE